MCGIAGFQYSSSSEVVLTERHDRLNEAVHSMLRRGPDSKGLYESNCHSSYLGHTRLAIQDLDPRSNQPFLSTNKRYSIVFNGEIYNFHELKKSFLTNHHMRTSSDTEVLLELFILLGPSCLSHLRGMFAFAIWDDVKKELFLARDSYGIKPLYFIEESNHFSFASQISALINKRDDLRIIEPAGVVGFYLMGSVPDPWTIYKNIFSLEKGSYLIVRNGKIVSKTLWNNFASNWNSEVNSKNIMNDVSNAVQDSVRSHLIADVPVSVFLSGGIDSSVIASLAADSTKVTGINISFNEFQGTKDDELPLAKSVAESLNIDFLNKVITKEEFESDFDEIISSMDQPSIDGINTWYASKAANEQGFKVALSGLGGDELFCGYPSFKQLPKIYNFKKNFKSFPFSDEILNFSFSLASKALNKNKIKYLNKYSDSLSKLYFFKRSNFLPHEVLELIGADIFEEGISKLEESFLGTSNIDLQPKIETLNDISKLSFLESNFYMHNQLLRDSDWASMHHSLELRTPLVDSYLLKSIGKHIPSMPKFPKKQLLASSTNRPLPDFILNKPKTGFSTPLAEWINSSLENKSWFIQKQHLGLSWSKKWAIALMQHKFYQ